MDVFQPAAVAIAATQTQMEAASSSAVFATPGNSQWHPGHPKFWAFITMSAGTPSLITSYNVTSITDTAVGQTGITIATDFSDANWASFGMMSDQGLIACYSSKAAGTVVAESRNTVTATLTDYTQMSFGGLGDQ